MVLPLTNQTEHFSETPESNLAIQNPEEKIELTEELNQTEWQDELDCEEQHSDEEHFEEEEESSDTRDFSQNQVQLNFSWSLMNQLRYLARTEGIGVEDLLIELVAESVTKRAFEDQNKPAPSHLMTRNGYVHHNHDGNSTHAQPQMSHHALNNNRMQTNQTNRNKPGSQQRNSQYNSTRYQNSNGRNNYQSNGRNNQQGNVSTFRQNNTSYNSQQRYNARSNANQPGAQSQNQGYQTPRYANENEPFPQNLKNKKY